MQGAGNYDPTKWESEIVLKLQPYKTPTNESLPKLGLSADDGDSRLHKRNWDGKQSRILKTWTNGFAAPSNPCAVNVPRGSQSREFFEVFEAPRNLPCELFLWVND